MDCFGSHFGTHSGVILLLRLLSFSLLSLPAGPVPQHPGFSGSAGARVSAYNFLNMSAFAASGLSNFSNAEAFGAAGHLQEHYLYERFMSGL